MLHAILAAVLAVSTPSNSGIDVFAWRQAEAAAFQKEKTRLDALLAAKRIDPADAERLARMMVAETSADPADFAARWGKVAAELKAARDALAVMKAGGPYPDDWQGSRWLKARAAATDADARALFEHVFYDQSALSMRGDVDARDQAAFSAALSPDRNAALKDNAAWLKNILARIGWFDISKYGAEASQAAWLMVQHADHDPEWQRHVLDVLEPKVETGDMQGKYFAYLIDRVNVNAGEAQIYGTQGRCVDGSWQPHEVNDPVILDRLRDDVGLEPMDTYTARFDKDCK